MIEEDHENFLKSYAITSPECPWKLWSNWPDSTSQSAHVLLKPKWEIKKLQIKLWTPYHNTPSCCYSRIAASRQNLLIRVGKEAAAHIWCMSPHLFLVSHNRIRVICRQWIYSDFVVQSYMSCGVKCWREMKLDLLIFFPFIGEG